jgi:hypothetical protein
MSIILDTRIFIKHPGPHDPLVQKSLHYFPICGEELTNLVIRLKNVQDVLMVSGLPLLVDTMLIRYAVNNLDISKLDKEDPDIESKIQQLAKSQCFPEIVITLSGDLCYCLRGRSTAIAVEEAMLYNYRAVNDSFFSKVFRISRAAPVSKAFPVSKTFRAISSLVHDISCHDTSGAWKAELTQIEHKLTSILKNCED